MRDALDLGFAIAHRIHAFAPARGADADAARLAVIDVAIELAQDHEVEPLHQLGPERRGADQLGEQERRPEVCKQLQLAPQREQAEPRALISRSALVAGSADRAEQDGVGLARQRERSRRQWHTGGGHTGGADRRFGESHVATRNDLQHLDRLGGDFLADPVARHDRDVHKSYYPALTHGEK